LSERINQIKQQLARVKGARKRKGKGQGTNQIRPAKKKIIITKTSPIFGLIWHAPK